MDKPSIISNENLVDGTPVKVETIFQAYDPNELEEQKIVKENESHIFTPEFIPYYPDIAIRFGLSHMETLIYGFIRFYMKNASKRFYFTNEQLASIMSCSPNTINISISNITKKGLIVKGHRIKSGGGTIRFISKVVVTENLYSEYQKTDTHHIRKLITNNNKINNNKIKEKKVSFSQTIPDQNSINSNKAKDQINLKEYLEVFNTTTKRKFRIIDSKSARQIKRLVQEGYTIEDWRNTILKALKDNFIVDNNYLTPEFISRPDKFEKYYTAKIRNPNDTPHIQDLLKMFN